MSHKLLTALLLCIVPPTFSHAIELGNETMADKADRFDFEEFHKEKGIVIWDEKKEKTTATYEENKPIKPVPAEAPVSSAAVAAPVASKNPTVTQNIFAKGDELKVREAYKLGNDPALRNVQSLYEAIEALHKQLNGYCPRGWIKDREWHLPEQHYFYIHYSAVCM